MICSGRDHVGVAAADENRTGRENSDYPRLGVEWDRVPLAGQACGDLMGTTRLQSKSLFVDVSR